jgi:hypothetical protein
LFAAIANRIVALPVPPDGTALPIHGESARTIH